MAKVSLISQILEVQREIAKRKQVYPRLVAKGDMRKAEGELLIGRMEAVLATLLFVQQHENGFRAYIADRKADA